MAEADQLAPDGSGANLSDQDSSHDQLVLAAAIVCARTQQPGFCATAKAGVIDAIGTEDDARWLAIGRNLAGYVIAADLIGLRADGSSGGDGARVEQWIASFLTKPLRENNGTDPAPLVPFGSGSNAAAQQGFVHASIAAYLGDRAALDRAWDAFRTFACDPTAPDRERITIGGGLASGWAHDDAEPCAVNPAGSTRDGVRIDGAIVNDMSRGGILADPPGYTQYPWVGLEGFVPAAVILERAGYPAFEVADRAVLRSVEYLWHLRITTGNSEWFDGERSAAVIHLTNVAYGRSFLLSEGPIGGGRTIGYVDYTHPNSI